MDTRPIGVLSSGVGGLTVLDELVSALPNEKFIFFADALRVPYGNKSSSEVVEYASQIANWLVRQDVKLVVVSCNTISSIALSYLQSKFSVPFVGIVDSCVSTVMTWEDLVGENLKRIGIIGSQTTLNSRVHESNLRTAGYSGEIFTAGCPLFLPILKSGVMDRNIWHAVMDYYLAPMRDNLVQGVVLASTGYTLISEFMSEFFGGRVQIFNPNPIFAKNISIFLDKNNLRNEQTSFSSVMLYSTGAAQVFDFFFNRYFEMRSESSVKIIEITYLI